MISYIKSNLTPEFINNVLPLSKFPFFHKQMEKRYNMTEDNFIFLEVDGETIGYISYVAGWLDSTVIDICNFEVSVNHQGKGWGREILTRLLQENTGTLTIQANRPGLITLYEKFGFKLSDDEENCSLMMRIPL